MTRIAFVGLLALGPILGAGQAWADEPAQQPRPVVQRPAPDFLFGRPAASIGVRGAWRFARAGSDWYDFVTDELTLSRKDFNAPTFGTDVSILVAPHVDAVFSLDVSQAKATSEYRRLVDNNRMPITQDTRLRQLNLGGGIRLNLADRGQTLSRFAWAPRSVVPYVGAGAGALWYSLDQTGDFVDFRTNRVFPDVFRSRGWTPSAHVFGGVDIQLHKRLFLTVDARYLWASAKLGRDWIDFAPLDLAGTHVSTGINILF